MTEVRIVRHGETRSYVGDVALTARGRAQARAAAAAVAEAAQAAGVSGPLPMRHAPTARAGATATELAAALRDGGTAVADPVPDDGFLNFQAVGPDNVPAEPTAVRGEHEALVQARLRGEVERPAGWLADQARFWDAHDREQDPIGLWLARPLPTFEPPARVVWRWWQAIRALDGLAPLVVVAGHSGPMRALASHAAGYDMGEPAHLEAVVIRLDDDGRSAQLTYRTAHVAVPIPNPEEPRWP